MRVKTFTKQILVKYEVLYTVVNEALDLKQKSKQVSLQNTFCT